MHQSHQLYPYPATDHVLQTRSNVLFNSWWQTYWVVIIACAVKLGFFAVICVLRQTIHHFITVICRLQYPGGRENKAHQQFLVGGCGAA
jgi:hypothetical protein